MNSTDTSDKTLLDALAHNSWDLRCKSSPIADTGDFDVYWSVIEHHQAKPHEREIATSQLDDPRDAIRRAIRHADPKAERCVACGEVLHYGDSVYYEHGEGGHIHSLCASDDPESFVDEDEQPLKFGDPIPKPFAFKAERETPLTSAAEDEAVDDHFSLPPEIAESAALIISGWQNSLMFSLAEQLEAIGVNQALAVHVEVNTLMIWASRAAVIACCKLEGRAPDRARWTRGTQHDFDAAIEWFRQAYPETDINFDAACLPAQHGADPSYLDFITPDEIFDQGPAAVQEWQKARLAAGKGSAIPLPSTDLTVADYADRLFNLHGFMLCEEYRGKHAVTITFPDLKQAQEFYAALAELSQHRSALVAEVAEQ